MDAVSQTLRYRSRHGALFIGPLPPPARHRHHAIQGCLALEGTLSIALDGEAPFTTDGAVLPSNVAHAVTGEGLVAHFYFAPESDAGRRLSQSGVLPRPLDSRVPADVRATLVALAREASPEAESRAATGPDDQAERMGALLDVLIACAGEGLPPAPPLSHSVASARRGLGRAGSAPILAALARETELSPDRLRHRFREEMGTTLRGYRLWRRLLRALDRMEQGATLTEAAYEAGFSDAAHLSRVFRAAFSYAPRDFAATSRFVQADPGGAA